MSEIDHRELYRLPWSFSDNVIAWLEPTAKCNLACEGCYRQNVSTYKSLEEISKELDTFERYRKFDGVSVAGGDPLLHPQLPQIIAEVTRRGHKAVMNTNGLALTEAMLRELKAAGLLGVTFHVDSKQGRPGWKNKSEVELNDLRLELATMVASVGGLSCAFNSTVYEDTLDSVPELVAFAEQHMDLVHTMVFILYRAAIQGGDFDYFAGGEKVQDLDSLVYASPPAGRINLNAQEVVAKIRERFPDFAPSAYLGGTETPDSFKWLITGRVGKNGKTYGYVGPRFMELVQEGHHLMTGRYLAYTAPEMLRMGRSMTLLGAVDKGLRGTFQRYAGDLLRNPLRATVPLHYQSILVIQPIDVLPDGRQNMCDGCPDMTVHNGELVWSCRLEERLKHGRMLTCAPRAAAKAAAAG